MGRNIYDLLTKGPDKEPTHLPPNKGVPRPVRRPPRGPPRGAGGFGNKKHSGGLFNFGKGGSRRPPRKTPLQIPMVQHSTGHVTPPLPGGNTFEFLPKQKRPKKQVNSQGGFLPSAPYFKGYDNLANNGGSGKNIQPSVNTLISSANANQFEPLEK